MCRCARRHRRGGAGWRSPAPRRSRGATRRGPAGLCGRRPAGAARAGCRSGNPRRGRRPADRSRRPAPGAQDIVVAVDAEAVELVLPAGRHFLQEGLERDGAFGHGGADLVAVERGGGGVEADVDVGVALGVRAAVGQDGPSVVGGMAIGISRMVVTPPAAAARVPLAKSSRSGWLGARQWKWESITPGSTSSPAASIVSAASGNEPGAERETICPFLTPTSR